MNKKKSPRTRPSRPVRGRRALARDVRVLLRGLYANLHAGALTTVFRAPAPRAWNASPGQLILIVIAAVLAGIALQRTFYGLAAEFDWSSLRGQWFDLPVYLFAGWLAVRFGARAIAPLTVPVALYAAGIVVGVAVVLLVHLALRLPSPWSGWLWLGAYYGGTLWFLAAAALLFRRTARWAWRHVGLALAPLMLLALYGVAWPPAPAWHPPTPPARAGVSGDSPVSEEILHLQPRLAREAFEAIAPQRPGITDLYFVGFAPYGRERVFVHESEVIRTLLDERFDTRGRSLLLVNDRSTLRKYPLATVTNLRAALAAIGRRIDPDEDVVLLHLTSHGSEDHRLAARFWPLRLDELRPRLLQTLLDEAGIGWRVVVVSACYAGGYIDPLQGPAALVMTAASSDRTSFGCGNDYDFTYFAKALFDEQLRATYSFERAFARALPVIREREQAQEAEYSDPQIVVGEAIRERLGALERRLEARAER